MKNFRSCLQQIWQAIHGDERGQDLIEYTLLLAFVAFASAAFFVSSGEPIKSIWTPTHVVTIKFDKSSTGSGKVVITGAMEQSCDMDNNAACTITYPANKPITLVAIPLAGSDFVSFLGKTCTGDDAICRATVAGDITVSAIFERRNP